MALLCYPNEVVVLSTVVISVGCGLMIVCLALPSSLGRLYRLLIFGGKERVVTCEMVVCCGFDALRPIASRKASLCRCIGKCGRMCDKFTFLMYTFTLTHVYAYNTHTRTHAYTHIKKLRYFLYLK